MCVYVCMYVSALTLDSMSTISIKEAESTVVATHTSAWSCCTPWFAGDARRLNRERGGVE